MSHWTGSSSIVATDRTHLWNLVRDVVGFKGHDCDLNHIDVSRVDDFSLMFSSLQFTGSVSKWNVSRGVDFSGMFEQSQWDVSNANTMAFMFAQCPFNNSSLATWDVSNVRSMHWMFRKNTFFNQDLKNWNPASLEDASSMFKGAPYTHDLSTWNVNVLSLFDGMFDRESLVQMPIPGVYHWCCLLDNIHCLFGHPHEKELVQHVAGMSGILAGLGLSQLDAARWLQRHWREPVHVESNTIVLPEFDNYV